jgi:hypothetical protein
MALTTHFAQVQFRLRQIISAPDEIKEVFKSHLFFLNINKVYLKCLNVGNA